MTATRTKTGVFTDDSGKPSSQKKIQDNDYYQDFSYVIQTSDSIDVWKQDVLKLLHPAGLKLFGEVAIATLLNAELFDRVLNNINSTLDNGLTQYRELSFQLISEVLNNLYVTAEVELVKEVQMDIFLQTLVQSTASVIEYLQKILSVTNTPAEFFSLLSVKNVSSIVIEEDLHLEYATAEDGGVILKEDGDKLLAEEPRTTIMTSEPHYLHENDEIYLDDFTGSVILLNSTNGTDDAGDKLLAEDGGAILNESSNTDSINGKLFSVQDVDIENSILLTEDGDEINLESEDGSLLSEDVAKFTLKDPISLTDYGELEFGTDDVDTTGLSVSTFGKVFRPSKTASSGLPIELLGREYIGEYTDYVIDHYTYHHLSLIHI